MKIGSAVWAVREPQKMVKKNKKIKNKGQQRYISRVRGGETPIGGMMKLGTFVDVPDVMNHANFHLRVMGSLGAGRGSRRGVLPLKCIWLLQHCLALPRWQVI